MKFSLQKESGLTLLEAVLALVLAVSITLMGLRLYSGFNRDNMVRKAQFNVNQLFEAVGMYYQANCRGILNPNYVTPPPLIKPLVITTDLLTPGYLPEWNPQANTVVDNSTYSVQLEQYSGSRMPSGGMIYNNWVITPPFNTSFTQNVGYINFWVVHIAVKLQTGLDPAAYTARLFASCSAASPTTPCTPLPAPGSYIIWEALPSFAVPRATSNLRLTMPRIKAFTNLYYTDDMYGAYNQTWGNGTGSPGTSMNNYLCGG